MVTEPLNTLMALYLVQIWVFTLLLSDAWCHSEYVDLTHDLHNTMVHWPGRKFTLRKEQAGKWKVLDWLVLAKLKNHTY